MWWKKQTLWVSCWIQVNFLPTYKIFKIKLPQSLLRVVAHTDWDKIARSGSAYIDQLRAQSWIMVVWFMAQPENLISNYLIQFKMMDCDYVLGLLEHPSLYPRRTNLSMQYSTRQYSNPDITLLSNVPLTQNIKFYFSNNRMLSQHSVYVMNLPKLVLMGIR